MKKVLLAFPFLVLVSCAATFPVKEAYLADITNGVCVKYEIYDLEEIKFRNVGEYPLVAKGPCDRMLGFKRSHVNSVLNYLRKAAKPSGWYETQDADYNKQIDLEMSDGQTPDYPR